MRDGNNIDTPSQGLAYGSSGKYGLSGMGLASMRMRMKNRGTSGGGGAGGREISERKQVGDAEEMVNLEKERRDGRSAGDWED